ncbi:glycoside hydrolase family 64 protein [Apiospora rasikravindrae]|uniref:Glycoside hydrolase family 64 protein n=1 Tax=Apiospora rasikravindrae TaxID=990691 RepID=A0ABR1RZ36_9PEZI
MPDSLDIQLQNQSTSSELYAYVTGLSLQQHAGSRVLIKADGRSLYFPANPPQILQPLGEDCAIPLGAPGGPPVTVRCPQMAGGRIWFSRDAKLTFLLNPGGPPGAALVEPSVLNPTDANAGVDFTFAEFTLNSHQLFANISYVDFVSRLPIALSLQDGAGVQHVSGMAADGLARLCDGLREQAGRDGKPWDKLVVPDKKGSPTPLRVLSPTHGGTNGANFSGYYEPLVEEVWQKYGASTGTKLKINTQAAAGVVEGAVNSDGKLLFSCNSGNEAFGKPNTADILGCNSGPFVTGPSPTRNAIIPRLAAGFLRSTLADATDHPSPAETHYRREPTNHYARLLHEVNLDGKGYAFAYDDVQPDGGADRSGKVNSGDPKVFVVTVGGGNAYVGDKMPI